jgi:hypothetical protein
VAQDAKKGHSLTQPSFPAWMPWHALSFFFGESFCAAMDRTIVQKDKSASF